MTDTTTDHDLRMLARAAFSVLRKFNPPLFSPSMNRVIDYHQFVKRENYEVFYDEFVRHERLRMGIKS